MPTVPLKPEHGLSVTGQLMYNIALKLGYSEDDLLTLAPSVANLTVDHDWILARWLRVVTWYEADVGRPFHWAFVGTKVFTRTMLWSGSGHVIFPHSSLPNWRTLSRLWKQEAGGDARHSIHSYDRPVHRSKVGYWAQHFDDADYVCDFSQPEEWGNC